MKWFVIFILFLGVAGFVFAKFFLAPENKIVPSFVKKDTPSNSVSSSQTTTLFVPYWTLSNKSLPTNYDTLVYFGITTNGNGIDTEEDGYKNLHRFFNAVSLHQRTLLTIRLLDQNTDEKILHDKNFQQKVITDSLAVAKQYHFDGVVLDLEYKALAFDGVIKSTTQLSTNFATASHKENLTFYQTIYGDALYRLRPFDVGAIGNVSDGIFVMAYDFHKANGNPGPNFPLYPLADEDYSFMQMVQDFSKKIPLEKITIIFGLFGYDWIVTSANQSVGKANTITTKEAEAKFLSSCLLKNCQTVRDAGASEFHIHYTDRDGTHEVWFEDMDSINKKEAYLKSKGIGSTAFWAWGYF